LHLRGAVYLLALAALAGCGGNSNQQPTRGSSVRQSGPNSSSKPSSGGTTSATNESPLKFKVIGKCYAEPGGGTLLSQSSGFTPNSQYSREAWYPKKPGSVARSQYTFLIRKGHTDARGHAYFKWDCNYTANNQPDPPGKYKLRVTDDKTGRSKTVFFRVLPAER
jgi:hypothetical protein